MTIVQTALANGLDACPYLEHIFTRMIGNDFRTDDEYLESLMPWNEEVRKACTPPQQNRETVGVINKCAEKNKKKNRRAAERRKQNAEAAAEDTSSRQAAVTDTEENTSDQVPSPEQQAESETVYDNRSENQDVCGNQPSVPDSRIDPETDNKNPDMQEDVFSPPESPEYAHNKATPSVKKKKTGRRQSKPNPSGADTLTASAMRYIEREKAKSRANEKEAFKPPSDLIKDFSAGPPLQLSVQDSPPSYA